MEIVLLIVLSVFASTMPASESPSPEFQQNKTPPILARLTPEITAQFFPRPESPLFDQEKTHTLKTHVTTFSDAYAKLAPISNELDAAKDQLFLESLRQKDRLITATAVTTLLVGGGTIVLSQKESTRMIPFWSIAPAITAGGVVAGVVGSIALAWNWRVSQAGKREAEKIAAKNLEKLREIEKNMNQALQNMRVEIETFKRQVAESRGEEKAEHLTRIAQFDERIENLRSNLQTTFAGLTGAVADTQESTNELRENQQQVKTALAQALSQLTDLQKRMGLVRTKSEATLEELREALKPKKSLNPFRRRSADSVSVTSSPNPHSQPTTPVPPPPSRETGSPADFNSTARTGDTGSGSSTPRSTVLKPAARHGALNSIPFNNNSGEASGAGALGDS